MDFAKPRIRFSSHGFYARRSESYKWSVVTSSPAKGAQNDAASSERGLQHLTYTRPLTKRQASDYELRPAPDNPDRPRSIREQMKTAAKLAEADRGQAAPKKNAPDRGER